MRTVDLRSMLELEAYVCGTDHAQTTFSLISSYLRQIKTLTEGKMRGQREVTRATTLYEYTFH